MSKKPRNLSYDQRLGDVLTKPYRPSKADAKKRKDFRRALASGKLLRFFGVEHAADAALVDIAGGQGVYISGSVLASTLRQPDIGIVGQNRFVQAAGEIASQTDLPLLVDIDTGFGSVSNAADTVEKLIRVGATACHIEDQVFPKRCGHLDNKDVVPVEEMVAKIKAMVEVRDRLDPNFVIVARVDSRTVISLDDAISRAKAYEKAGADMIFPEAMHNMDDFKKMRKAVKIPLLANLTEFGKTELGIEQELQQVGYNIALYPVTLHRLKNEFVLNMLAKILKSGSQVDLIDMMADRKAIQRLVDYDGHAEKDKSLAGFNAKAKVNTKTKKANKGDPRP